MGNIKKKQDARLKRRQSAFDMMRKPEGMKRPGSMNPHKSDPTGKVGRKRR